MTSRKKKSKGTYEVIRFPKERKMVIDIMEQGMKKHYIKGLVEFDVTHGREQLKNYKLKHGKKPETFVKNSIPSLPIPIFVMILT